MYSAVWSRNVDSRTRNNIGSLRNVSVEKINWKQKMHYEEMLKSAGAR